MNAIEEDVHEISAAADEIRGGGGREKIRRRLGTRRAAAATTSEPMAGRVLVQSSPSTGGTRGRCSNRRRCTRRTPGQQNSRADPGPPRTPLLFARTILHVRQFARRHRTQSPCPCSSRRTAPRSCRPPRPGRRRGTRTGQLLFARIVLHIRQHPLLLQHTSSSSYDLRPTDPVSRLTIVPAPATHPLPPHRRWRPADLGSTRGCSGYEQQ